MELDDGCVCVSEWVEGLQPLELICLSLRGQREIGLSCPDGRWPLWRQPRFKLLPGPFENASALLEWLAIWAAVPSGRPPLCQACCGRHEWEARQRIRIPVQAKATYPDFRLHVTQHKIAKDASVATDIVALLYCKKNTKYNLNQFPAEPLSSDRRKGQKLLGGQHIAQTATMRQFGEFYFHVNNCYVWNKFSLFKSKQQNNTKTTQSSSLSGPNITSSIPLYLVF